MRFACAFVRDGRKKKGEEKYYRKKVERIESIIESRKLPNADENEAVFNFLYIYRAYIFLKNIHLEPKSTHQNSFSIYSLKGTEHASEATHIFIFLASKLRS